jgi:uncharacterized protein YlxP (DUF503 family)
MTGHQPLTDKEILEQLGFQENYEAAYRLTELKIKNAVLKTKLKKLRKKYGVVKAELNRLDESFDKYMEFVTVKNKK